VRRLIPFVASWFIRALHATLRVRHVHLEKLHSVPQYILTFWHSHLLLMLHAAYRRPMMALISQSRDGELVARVIHQYDAETARGSSTRGGTGALRDLMRAARSGSNLAFTPDGPKGPPRVAKEGVITVAQATGLPIVPVAFAAKKKSYCARGIAWWCHVHSRARSSSTATRSWCRVTAKSNRGAHASSWN
jgi:lysophospholipid acyltransferase (LPLAT)-like uncharacterized protein